MAANLAYSASSSHSCCKMSAGASRSLSGKAVGGRQSDGSGGHGGGMGGVGAGEGGREDVCGGDVLDDDDGDGCICMV